MHSRIKWAAILVMAALVLGALALPALAEEVTARRGAGTVQSALADRLGISLDGLGCRKGGKSFMALAAEQGLTPADVADARKALIAELVAAGKLTPEQAQACLERIEACDGEGGGRGQRLGKGCGLRGAGGMGRGFKGGQRCNPIPADGS